jgi:hypothetical protein
LKGLYFDCIITVFKEHMMKSAFEIANDIQTSNLTAEGLDEIIAAVKYARARLARTVIRQLAPGASVRFQGRNGRLEQGIVKSIGRKNVVVFTGTANWRVSANLLEVV